jgi:phosphate-selective porin OprO/OprP
MVDTGTLSASSTGVLGTEAAYVHGPFSIQAEWAMCYLNDVTTGSGKTAITTTRSFNGGYVTCTYFLTGETRAYDKEFGTFARYYVTPITTFWWKEGTMGLGAWEFAVRYSYLNLNDGPIVGGVMGGLTVGLNWYLNPSMKIQFQYLNDQRYDKGTTGGGTVPGVVQGIGTRVQISF